MLPGLSATCHAGVFALLVITRERVLSAVGYCNYLSGGGGQTAWAMTLARYRDVAAERA
jgi:hypothetical protein